MNATGTYKIRPSGRHILTIGRDLIQDAYAAVMELVKNAYDADSPDVNIKFMVAPRPQRLFHHHLRPWSRHVQRHRH